MKWSDLGQIFLDDDLELVSIRADQIPDRFVGGLAPAPHLGMAFDSCLKVISPQQLGTGRNDNSLHELTPVG